MRLAMLLALGLMSSAAAQTTEQLLAQSEPVIQDQIARVYAAINRPGIDPKHDPTVRLEVQALSDIVAAKHEIVKQLAIYSATPGEEAPLAANMILQLLDFPPTITVRVLGPYLDSENANLKSFALDSLQRQMTDDDCKKYIRGLANLKQEVPAAFAEYIFKRSPGQALLIFYSAYRTKEPGVLLAEHIVSNAIWLQEHDFAERFQAALPEATAELTKLAGHKDWWVRLYVAEIMRQHRQLRQPTVVEQLADDSNPMVSQAAKRAKG